MVMSIIIKKIALKQFLKNNKTGPNKPMQIIMFINLFFLRHKDFSNQISYSSEKW